MSKSKAAITACDACKQRVLQSDVESEMLWKNTLFELYQNKGSVCLFSTKEERKTTWKYKQKRFGFDSD
jgi:hypothetical protein